MSVLTLGKDKSDTTAKTIKDIFDEVFGSSRRSEMDIPGIASLPKDRRNRVVMVRRQIARGTYNIDERMDSVIEDVFMDLKQQ
jgi:hypothetical protein